MGSTQQAAVAEVVMLQLKQVAATTCISTLATAG